MFGLAQTTGYAIFALSCLENPSGQPRLVTEVAELTGIPRPYLWKIMHLLRQRGLVTAKRGYRGGVILARPAEQISLAEVATAIEGDNWLAECMLGLPDCADLKICPTHNFWLKTRDSISKHLQGCSLASVARHIGRSNNPSRPLIRTRPRKAKSSSRKR